MAMIDNLQNWARKQLAPMTIGLMVALIFGSLFFWFTQGRFYGELLFQEDWLSRPWTLLTYPFAFAGLGGINQIIWFLVLLSWMLLTCASTERELGTAKYACLWAVMTVVPALIYYGGELVVRREETIAGPFFPVAGISFIWALRHKSFTVNLWGLLPLNGVWIACIIFAGILFGYGMAVPLLGLFAVLYLGLAYLVSENRIPYLTFPAAGYKAQPSKAERARQSAYFDEVRKREQERAERERLRKLFEGSLNDDKD